jgi:hypothetical protein
MQTITGHLTATEKKHITAILNANLMQGKVNRKNYFLTLTDNVYTVLVTQNSTQWCETKPRITTNKHTFKL